jgi:superfamily II DNA or RNA helicase
MVNLTHSELKEVQYEKLPPASLETLKELRGQACQMTTSKTEFNLQPQQIFLRRVLSPDSPTRSLLMVHGTGVGKTCTAIQIAEEYIIRPEFQDKRVLVIASDNVQDNFKNTIFNLDRNNIRYDEKTNTLLAQQCTGRRYLDILLRIESEPRNWENPEIRRKLENTADKIVDEFYEFNTYDSFAREIEQNENNKKWFAENFDNRLVIIDEAHNIRNSEDEDGDIKRRSKAFLKLAEETSGMVLVLLTATPMYDSEEEILFYMKLFALNEKESLSNYRLNGFFDNKGEITSNSRKDILRKWAQRYISYVKGESPFTFPFRLTAPFIASPSETKKDFFGKIIKPGDRLKYIPLTGCVPQGEQLKILKLQGISKEDVDAKNKQKALLAPTNIVMPKKFSECFEVDTHGQYSYKVEHFLTPENLPNYSAKFVSILSYIENSEGISIVFASLKGYGIIPFAMALEEHGYNAVVMDPLLKTNSYTGKSKGGYIMITSGDRQNLNEQMIRASKHPNNKNGEKIKVVLLTQTGAEGVDFKYIRNVHILEPWWNSSRIEQVIGRGLRTCSHQALPFEKQNCTIYYHILRREDHRETFDEYSYRTKIEQKSIRITKVKRILEESAMDCPMQQHLSDDWLNLKIPQVRSFKNEEVNVPLKDMMAPTFTELQSDGVCIHLLKNEEDPNHLRPLASYLDIKDELTLKLENLFRKKPIWDTEELLETLPNYSKDVIIFTLQQSITNSKVFTDNFGRPALMESRENLYALAPKDISNKTRVERSILINPKKDVEITNNNLEVQETEEVNFEEERKKISISVSDLTKDGYIFDRLKVEQKREVIKTHTLPFLNRLKVSGTNIYVLGNKVFEPTELPIGKDKTKYDEWVQKLIDRFISNKNKLFASVAKNGKVTISSFDIVDGKIVRSLGKKRFEPTICGTGSHTKEKLIEVAKFIDPTEKGIPEKLLKTSGSWCDYIEFLARKEHNIVWITPEELSVLTAPEQKARVLGLLK